MAVADTNKILNSEFRNNLYKDLVDAGYTKDEAQTIVGRKYYDTLKVEAKKTVDVLSLTLSEDNFLNIGKVDFDKLKNDFAELMKMYEILNKKKE